MTGLRHWTSLARLLMWNDANLWILSQKNSNLSYLSLETHQQYFNRHPLVDGGCTKCTSLRLGKLVVQLDANNKDFNKSKC
jgi:ABC-type transport system involved in cytochrome c biogenesis ATPase subunit